jgi:hypothetical protein
VEGQVRKWSVSNNLPIFGGIEAWPYVKIVGVVSTPTGVHHGSGS